MVVIYVNFIISSDLFCFFIVHCVCNIHLSGTATSSFDFLVPIIIRTVIEVAQNFVSSERKSSHPIYLPSFDAAIQNQISLANLSGLNVTLF